MRLSCTIHLPPGDLAVNRAWRVTQARTLVKSKLYRQSRKLVADELRDAADHAEWPRGFRGEVRVRIEAYWPGSLGDVDAPIKGVLDALQQAGVVLDDKQICHVSCERLRDDADPRLVVHVAE